ncbi:chalcone isomerase family protein [Aquabacterium sp.]|uniref:chalcone isomerase family protein n=1 Tax=Aquabacterium sp. TaxID=1872578 RepID=UPI002E352013|nr:chalcone isomerase family protein [Aquabacterium sp.]HEX5310280.1 chalcone isomerase family protein [Aquabacterium sp.]
MSDTLDPRSEVNGLRRKLLLGAAAATTLGPWVTSAHAGVELEGVTVADTAMVGGKKLVLNGAAVRKRGYFKADVTALYMPEKRTNPDAIFKLDGPRRIQLNILREFTSGTISRIFVADFKQSATDEEFKKLITVVGQIGQAYGNIKSVNRGDVVNLDWVPGTGWTAAINNKPVMIEAGVPLVIKDELAYQIYMRMYLGPSAPDELRNGLLGLTKLHSKDD